MSELKKCTISGIIDLEENFHKEGKYPYVKFVERFRARYQIPVKELRGFLNDVSEHQKQNLNKLTK
tara:strand:- start:205 stop:402 length:198 start_codon:yes stop_codon:yes gene_type:complete